MKLLNHQFCWYSNTWFKGQSQCAGKNHFFTDFCYDMKFNYFCLSNFCGFLLFLLLPEETWTLLTILFSWWLIWSSVRCPVFSESLWIRTAVAAKARPCLAYYFNLSKMDVYGWKLLGGSCWFYSRLSNCYCLLLPVAPIFSGRAGCCVFVFVFFCSAWECKF